MSSQPSLGVGVVGIGWCAAQHINAFIKNPHTRIVGLCGRDEARTRANLEKYEVLPHDGRITTRFEDLLADPDIHIISIATPNDLHAEQAIAAARAGKHVLIEKPTAMNLDELDRVSTAIRQANVKSIVSFELRFNPYMKFVHWLRESGRLGNIRFTRVQYLSRVTDWYSGWEWCRTRQGGGSHLLAAGCHAVDALRWLSGKEVVELSAYQTHFTAGYEWPTTILVNMKLQDEALGHVSSSTDFQMPYTFQVEVMGDKATVRDTTLLWKDEVVDLEELQAANPWPDLISLEKTTYGTAFEGIRINTMIMPDSVDVAHHPFQAEIDDLVDGILTDRQPALNVFDAEKTMRICVLADQSAEQGGAVITL
ncbi:MAG: Gfo/Idh/MocA family oxidoreductase [Acidobacteria bacterium]|nr:Gfo/Idh/MocA family oxidoreductase [Acidobacteriota bacterium]